MALSRFYIDSPLSAGSLENLPDSVGHHIRKVLRLRDGDTIGLWNGDGQLRLAHLKMSDRTVAAAVASIEPGLPEPGLHISLIQGLPEGDKMDWIIEKACESGVTAIYPVQARRSVVRLSGERMAKRHAHWQRVAIAACSQCGRTRLPVIHPLTDAESAFQNSRSNDPQALPWLLSPAADRSACEALRLYLKHRDANEPSASPPALLMAVGPEGGWDDKELQLAGATGFQAVSLGALTLRTETAGLFASAQALAWQQAWQKR